MTQSSQKKKQIHYKNDNVLEALGSVPTGVGKAAVSEVTRIGGDIFTSLLGSTPQGGELAPNQAIEFGKASEQPAQAEPQPMKVEMYPKQDMNAIEMETRKQLEAIRQELKALIASLKNLHQEVQTAVSQEVVNPGVYHINFFEQLKTFIKVLRQQIEDSRVWLAAFTTRKKKLGYWGMFKKHGTTFGLSSERSLATAAG